MLKRERIREYSYTPSEVSRIREKQGKWKMEILVPISSTGKILGKCSSIQQRSPSMKGLPSPLRLKQTAKDRSFDWDRQTAIR
ncbi:hypothetical protein L3X38_026302 [Prunus dulcis]|uniref:Uncharacterized protein n=1 Tax=Prunus dulcis TaxID=3755 RepID=A0AAD4UPS6_PRUDU|nr:hypothetical protein L3X38_026302 [Prunus dulcis]